MIELEKWFNSDEFHHKKIQRIPKWVKIYKVVETVYNMYKTKGGVIRTAQEAKIVLIGNIGVSVDFQFFPKSKLEEADNNLRKIKQMEKTLNSKIKNFYNKKNAENLGVDLEDINNAIIEAE